MPKDNSNNSDNDKKSNWFLSFIIFIFDKYTVKHGKLLTS